MLLENLKSHKALFLILSVILLIVALEIKPVYSQNDDDTTDTEQMSSDSTSAESSVENAEEDAPPKFWEQTEGIIILALSLTAISGILARFSPTRKLKPFILLASLAFFGFNNGGCPCPICSFQNIFFGLTGEQIGLISVAWFLGLIPITYLFGQTWCGWVCHLGGLQEFIYKGEKFNILKSRKAQKIMRIIRYAALVALITQIFITRENFWREIDPFRTIFNISLSSLIDWIMVLALLISSVFVYRPFCQSLCPIGLVLGWISHLPGASILARKKDSKACSICSGACKIGAIYNSESGIVLDNKECFACGDCIDACKQQSIKFARKSSKNKVKSICEKRQ